MPHSPLDAAPPPDVPSWTEIWAEFVVVDRPPLHSSSPSIFFFIPQPPLCVLILLRLRISTSSPPLNPLSHSLFLFLYIIQPIFNAIFGLVAERDEASRGVSSGGAGVDSIGGMLAGYGMVHLPTNAVDFRVVKVPPRASRRMRPDMFQSIRYWNDTLRKNEREQHVLDFLTSALRLISSRAPRRPPNSKSTIAPPPLSRATIVANPLACGSDVEGQLLRSLPLFVLLYNYDADEDLALKNMLKEFLIRRSAFRNLPLK
ncbi:hypothetical protein ACMD2_22422, partial [Ananas comosus]